MTAPNRTQGKERTFMTAASFETGRSRWIALIVLCMGSLMIVLDTTIVNVALPSIRLDLGFSQTSLAWVVNGYLLTFGGFLLLGGRLGDHFGHRRMFIGGIALFTFASLACGVSMSQGFLIAARTIQGFGGAVVSAVSLSLIVSLFTEPAAFLVIEAKIDSPLVPLKLFRLRNLATANGVGVLWAAAMFAWFFLSALYLQLVLGYSPLQVGLAFLPANLIMAVFSLGVSAKLVMRFGIKAPLSFGLALAAVGLVLFVRAPVDGHYWSDVFPSMTLLGFGAGMALNPVLLAASGDVPQSDAGLASGIVNTSFMMGGALGLAVLASVAASRTSHLLASGHARPEALVGGYHVAFLIGAAFAAVAAVAAGWLLRTPAPAGEATAEEPAASSESNSSRHVGSREPVAAEC